MVKVKFSGGVKKIMEIEDSMKIKDLKALVAKEMGGNPVFNLIAKGKKLTEKFDEKTIAEMNFKIKEGKKLPILVLRKRGADEVEEKGDSPAKKQQKLLEPPPRVKQDIQKILKSARSLAEKEDDGIEYNPGYYLELQDNTGNKINLPKKDREAISLGLTLHEKGKEYRKRGPDHHATALEIFILAHNALSQANQQILSMIDNFPILCLDICWMYYKMDVYKDPKVAGEALRYLREAEAGFNKAYGKNLERLSALRQDKDYAPERVLLIRLKFLQALCAYYQADHAKAQNLLLMAEIAIRKVAVSDDYVVQIMSMGFSERDARLGLRVNGNKVEPSIMYLLNKKDEAKKAAEEERRRLRDRREARSYGLTKDNKLVDLKLLESISSSEFAAHLRKETIIEAIKQSGNNRETTLNMILNPDTVQTLDKAVDAMLLRKTKVAQLVSIGAGRREARDTLKRYEWNVELASNVFKLILKGFKQEDIDRALVSAKKDYGKAYKLLKLTYRSARWKMADALKELQDSDWDLAKAKDSLKKKFPKPAENLEAPAPAANPDDPPPASAPTSAENSGAENSPENTPSAPAKAAEEDEKAPAEEEKKEDEEEDGLNMDLLLDAIEGGEDPDSHLDSDLTAESMAIKNLKAILQATTASK